MTLRIGIITVRDRDYHPNRRLLEATRQAGHAGRLIHPYRVWPAIIGNALKLVGEHASDRPDVVLPRQGAEIGDACLSLIRQLQQIGISVVNDAAAIAIARDKFITHQVLSANGLPCPDTVFVNDPGGFIEAADRLGGYPVIAKPVCGRQGEGVMRIMDADDAGQRVLPALDRRRGMMVQRYLAPDNRRDLRVLVIGSQLVCAAELVPASGDFRANFHLGAEMRAADLPAELGQIAVNAAAAVGCDVAGVDLMIDGHRAPYIVEVNYSPGFKGMEAASGLDIAARIIDHVVRHHHQQTKGPAR